MALELALVFLGVAGVAWVALQPTEAAVRVGRRARELLRRHAGAGASRLEGTAQEEAGVHAPLRQPRRTRLSLALDGMLAGFKLLDRLAVRLRRADLRLQPGEFAFFAGLVGLAGLVLGAAAGRSPLLGLAGLGVGLFLPV
ncbi:MAG: hypothetical protein K6T75_09070, partial [Acetobacteraceae bacterium]|nr:hypothetical protein [Acetobacteraceae bacterium]